MTQSNQAEADVSSLFETAADFFSLFSLASIVAVLVYSAATVNGGSTRSSIVEPGDVPAGAVVSNTLFLAARESRGRPRVEIRYQASILTTLNVQLARGEERTSSIGEVVAALAEVLQEREPADVECLVEDPPSDELLGYYWELQDALAATDYGCTRFGKLR